MKKILSAVLAGAMFLSAWTVTSVAAIFEHSGYWPLHDAYLAAMDTPPEEDDITTGRAIIEFYRGMEDVTSCQRLVSPCLRLGRIYESRGMFKEAKAVFELLHEAQTYVLEETGEDYGMMYLECLLDQYAFIKPTIYAQTGDVGLIPHYGARGEPAFGTFAGMCDAYDPSISTGALIYVEFTRESFKKYDFRVPDKKENSSVEFAWNIPTDGLNIEMFRAIAEGAHDEYVIENLTWLQSVVPDTVFLRFAAEVNCWGIISTYQSEGRLEEFVEAYKAAFRHIAELRDLYAPKAAMVYSVTEVSNIHVDHTTFYPGDEYVDYVGVSSYTNKSSNATWEWGSYTDAFNGIGNYENPITKLKRIVDDFGHSKPILITECGFCYESTKSEQTAEHAERMLRYFYTYVNMVFPQVKGVFYFNTNFGGNSYKLFDYALSGVHGNADVYTSIMESNIGFSSLREGVAGGYTEARNIAEVTDLLKLSVFAAYPGAPETNVSYLWDGVEIPGTASLPYSAEINKEHLTVGEHRLSVNTDCGTEVYTIVYRVTVDNDGKVTVGVIPGDTDLNGKVNVADVSAMLKHIAKWDVDIDAEAADVDENGRVGVSDVSLTLKHIAGWENTI